MKLNVARKFLKHAIPDFANKLLFVSFLSTNTVYEYALYSTFQLKTQEIDTSNESQNL